MKYEIPAVGRKLAPLYIAWGVTAIMLGLALGKVESKSEFIMVISGLLYAAVTTAIFVMAIFVIVQRFNKSLLGDEGYFSHVLPVTASEHIFSKLLSSLIWVVLTGLAAFLTGIIITICAGQIGEIWRAIIEALQADWSEIMAQLNGQFWLAVLEGIILSILAISKTVMQIYTALSIGHQARDKVTLASIGAYIGLLTAESILGRLFVVPLMNMYENASATGNFNLFLLFTIVITAAFIAAYFFICKYLMEKKLNLA